MARLVKAKTMDKMLIICFYCLMIISSFSFGFAVGYNARQLDKKGENNGNNNDKL